MYVIDTHCDVLYKLQQAKHGKRKGFEHVSFKDSKALDDNLNRLKKGNVKIQFFAVFIHPDVPSDQVWQDALEQVDLFHTEVLEPHPEIRWLKSWRDVKQLQDGEIGAVLALEGGEAIGNDTAKLRTLYRLGVLSLGLTWNKANLLADGASEPRGGGLTEFGREVVALNNKYGVLTDVSHLSERGFWDVIELAEAPFASHSNARALCDHPRNLTDEQIRALIQNNGRIHVVFHPLFLKKDSETAAISDLIRHIDHICSLGGEQHIGFGSDFDGIDAYVTDLEHAGKYENLIYELLRHYSEDTVKGFAYQNFLRFLQKNETNA